jgi:hypothetical protein
MNRKTLLAFALLGTLLARTSQAQTCVKFGPPPPLGTTYGAPAANVSGDLVLTESGVKMHVYNFFRLPMGIAFNRAYTDIAPISLPGQSIRTNNINLLFDFRNLGFNVRKVTFSYLDLGGYENLSINGSGVYRGELSAAPAAIGGASVSVTSSPTPPPISGKTGTVTITASTIKTVMVGGQELWIDKVCAQ